MKRKNQKRKPLQMVVNQKVLDIIEDPAVIEYIARKLIRRRPAFKLWKTKDNMVWTIGLPRWVWGIFLWIVLAPATKEESKENA
jgi:hypothetical protein